MQKLDPKAVWLFFIGKALLVSFTLLAPMLFGYVSTITQSRHIATASMSEVALVTVWFLGPSVGLLLILWIWAKLHYRFYSYELREDGFRKELGIIWKKYVTIPYDRIQNVDVYRGPIARMLGLSDLNIQTAGASAQISRYGVLGAAAEGRLPGLSQEVAEKLRDELVQRARSFRTQGL